MREGKTLSKVNRGSTIYWYSRLLSSLLLLTIFSAVSCIDATKVEQADDPAASVGASTVGSTTITLTSGNNQATIPDNNFHQNLVVQLSGSQISGVPVKFALSSESTATAVLSSYVIMSSGSGYAAVTVTAGSTLGNIVINVSLPTLGITSSSSFNLTVSEIGLISKWQLEQVNPNQTIVVGAPFQVLIKAMYPPDPTDPSQLAVETNYTGDKQLQFSTNAAAAPSGDNAQLPADGLYSFINGVGTTRVIVKSGVCLAKLSSILVILDHLISIFKFNSSYHFCQVIE
ncbi:MAG: hypothetical protein HN730_02340, partial [Bdellovibrionales bacterium]|nr:hypothetical protein [Bdellovibrionales bacterium]